MSWHVPVLVPGMVVVSIVGELLLSSQPCRAVEPSLGKGIPASPQMMQRVRDEHSLVAEMSKANNPGPRPPYQPLTTTAARGS